jgi:hypothetical protein
MRDPDRLFTATAAILAGFACAAGLSIARPALGANNTRPPDPCNKELSVDDVRDILTGPAAINHYSMSESTPGEGCAIGVKAKASWALVDISMRKGNAESFQSLTFFVPPPHIPMAGLGDEAFATATTKSNVPNAKETDLYVRKGGLQCIAQLHRSNGEGEKLVIPTTDGAIATKLAGLCKKLFAAHSGP